jgi:hypothetical protein
MINGNVVRAPLPLTVSIPVGVDRSHMDAASKGTDGRPPSLTVTAVEWALPDRLPQSADYERLLRPVSGVGWSIQNVQFCSGRPIAQAEGSEPGQAADLLAVLEIEVLAHVRRAMAALPARVPCVIERVLITGNPPERTGRGVIDVLVRQGDVPGAVHGTGYSRMADKAVRGIGSLLIPVTALRYEPCPEVSEAVVGAAGSDEVGRCPHPIGPGPRAFRIVAGTQDIRPDWPGAASFDARRAPPSTPTAPASPPSATFLKGH